MLDDPRQVWLAGLVSLAGRFADIVVGAAPITPKLIWLPNRILTTFAIAASIALALALQRHRLSAQRSRDAALSARAVNRLLMSLVAHDLRSPLVVASQAIEYVSGAAAAGRPFDMELLADARVRLRRSLRAIETILEVAAGGSQGAPSRERGGAASTCIREAIEAELASFSEEAAARGKQFVQRLESLGDRRCLLDALVLRQALAILIDNALRYGAAGPVWIDGTATDGELSVRVTDSGPGLSAERLARGSGTATMGGSGLGLELCRALVANAGGSLVLERDGEDGTSFCLRLPIQAPVG
jgi:signal transduction histidine kinase